MAYPQYKQQEQHMAKRTQAEREADRQVTADKQRNKQKRRAKWERFGWAVQRQVERLANNTYGLTTGEGMQCRFVDADGKQCGSAAMRGGYYCRSHSKP